MSLPAALGRVVVRRAVNRCEYCGLSQAGQEAQFHVEKTPVGRATVAGLKLNRPVALAIRSEEAERGRHSPPVW